MNNLIPVNGWVRVRATRFEDTVHYIRVVGVHEDVGGQLAYVSDTLHIMDRAWEANRQLTVLGGLYDTESIARDEDM